MTVQGILQHHRRTGTALNVANTTIGADDLTFQSISANGAVNGIVLNTTGSSGGLTVTGTDGGDAGTDPDAWHRWRRFRALPGTLVSLTSASNVSLGGLTINNTSADGINMNGGSNLTLNTATISNSRQWR